MIERGCIRRLLTTPAELSKTISPEGTFTIQDIQLVERALMAPHGDGPALKVTYVFQNSVRDMHFEITTAETSRLLGREKTDIIESIREQIKLDIVKANRQETATDLVSKLRKEYLGKTIKIDEENSQEEAK